MHYKFIVFAAVTLAPLPSFISTKYCYDRTFPSSMTSNEGFKPRRSLEMPRTANLVTGDVTNDIRLVLSREDSTEFTAQLMVKRGWRTAVNLRSL